MAPPPAPWPSSGRGPVGRTGSLRPATCGRSGRRELEAPPVAGQIAAVDATVDLQPAQRLVEVTATREHLADAARAVDLAQARLRGQDQAEAVQIATREGQRERRGSRRRRLRFRL